MLAHKWELKQMTAIAGGLSRHERKRDSCVSSRLAKRSTKCGSDDCQSGRKDMFELEIGGVRLPSTEHARTWVDDPRDARP